MKTINLKNIVYKEDKHFIAQCLNVDVSSFKRTKNEALKNLKEASDLYFKDTNINNIIIIEHPEIVNQSWQYA